MIEAGEQVGIRFQFEKPDILPTMIPAHRLLHAAKLKSLDTQHKLQMILFRNYYDEGKDVSKPEVLKGAAEEAQLPLEEDFFESDRYERDVRVGDHTSKYRLGVTGVPYFIFNNKFAFSGAQEASAFLQVFRRLLK